MDSNIKKPRIFAIVNQKGGVGKTTTAVNLATAMAACKNKVLLIDLDAQGNATTGLGLDRGSMTASSYHVVMGGGLDSSMIVETGIPGLSLVASSIDLSGAELELVNIEKREYKLRESLQGFEGDFDYIFVDCPPTLGLITLNALCAADCVLVPLQCEFYALEGLSLLMKTIKRVQKSFNPSLELQGVVLTMYDGRNNLSDAVVNDVREYFGDVVYKTMIPRNVKVSEAPSFGKPVIMYDISCRGSQAYLHLASEVLTREQRIPV